MSGLTTKEVPVRRLELHEKIPLASLEVRHPADLGNRKVIMTPILIDRASSRVVGGLVGHSSALSVIEAKTKGVSMVITYVDYGVEGFDADWPLLEARVSGLNTRQCQDMLIALLVRNAPCVAKDRGRAVASMLGIGPRRLKRIRARVAHLEVSEAQDAHKRERTTSAAKARKPRIRSTPDHVESSAPVIEGIPPTLYDGRLETHTADLETPRDAARALASTGCTHEDVPDVATDGFRSPATSGMSTSSLPAMPMTGAEDTAERALAAPDPSMVQRPQASMAGDPESVEDQSLTHAIQLCTPTNA